jgi:CopG family nickel-responsive transcriptional regulator
VQRVTISLDENLAETFDDLLRRRDCQNRSEAVRDLMRGAVDALRLEVAEEMICVANLLYIFDQRPRGTAALISRICDDHHDLAVSTAQISLDRNTCFASTIIKGPGASIRRLSDRICAARGVRLVSAGIVDGKSDQGSTC